MTAEDGECWAELERKSNEAARVLLGTAIKRIAQLEAALVEERAVYTYGDGRLAFYREVEQTRNIYYDDARRQLEESGILLNVDKLQNGSN